jgi:hypothetical protein
VDSIKAKEPGPVQAKEAEDDPLFEMAFAAVFGDTNMLNKTYRKLAKSTHPDVVADAAAEMVKLNTTVEDYRKIAELAAKIWHITAILDDSGSMSGTRRNRAVSAFNTFVAGQKEVAMGRAVLSIQPLHPHRNNEIASGFKPITATPKLLQKQFRCGGNTPLLDAVGSAIQQLEAIEPTPQNVIILIVTDGAENGSRTWSYATLPPLVAEKIAQGWQFIYVSMCEWSIERATRMGIPKECTALFQDFSQVMNIISTGLTQLRLGQIKQLTFNPATTEG